jgi:glycosyltransferase involved in cell wall biosynthesis
MKILHLTHTDILSDNRILKEMGALADVEKFHLHGVGVRQRQGGKTTRTTFPASIVSVDLLSRKLRVLPGFLRHALVALEMISRMFYHGAKLRADVVHCHDTPVLLVGVLLKQLFGGKLVYDAHELESNKNGQSASIARLTLWIERVSWSSIDHFISVSPSIIDWYRDNLGEKPSSLILNSPIVSSEPCLTKEVTDGASRYFHRTFEIPESSRVFLYLGLLEPGRGIELILNAFSSEGVRSHVVFVGYGAFAKLIQEHAGIGSRIHLHPPVPHEDVVLLSSSADFGLCIIERVSLSDYYCLPNKLFEYAFAGIPVLASRFPDISSLVHKYELGECCDIDTASIVEAVQRMEQQQRRGIARDLRDLGWASQSHRLRQVYMSFDS